jgi:hypothetical protein
VCTAGWVCTSASSGTSQKTTDTNNEGHFQKWESFRSVGMDSWSPIQLKKMQAGGNANLNDFLKV